MYKYLQKINLSVFKSLISRIKKIKVIEIYFYNNHEQFTKTFKEIITFFFCLNFGKLYILLKSTELYMPIFN